MATFFYPVQQNLIVVDVQIVYCEAKQARGMIRLELVHHTFIERVDPKQIGPCFILLPLVVPFHVVRWVGGNCHHQV